MTIDPDVVDMIGKFVAVNAVATLLLAVLSYTLSAVLLSGLARLDRWLDTSQNEEPAKEVKLSPLP
jgi:hypothetical protein